jgi:hypothetical protein
MRWILTTSLLLFEACTPDWPSSAPPPPTRDEVTLRVEPEDEGSAVLRLTLEGSRLATVSPSDVAVFEGPLSDAQLTRWIDDDLTESLRERLVPSTIYASEGALRVVPHRVLRLGAEHTVALRPEGERLSFWPDESAPVPALRVFPPAEVEARGSAFVYCTEATGSVPAAALAPSELALEPGGQVATVERLTLDPRCVLVRTPPAGGALAHPPRSAFGLDLDPAPLRLTPSDTTGDAVTCRTDEVALARACARVEDDRLIVGPSTEPTLYVFEKGGEISRRSGGPGVGFEWRGLEPGTTQRVHVAIVTASGADSLEVWITTEPARPRLQISEVMANPEGPEPQQEWIELVNEGTAAADTSGVELFDEAGSVPLPPFSLAPGARALLVREDFDAAAGGTPLDEASLLRLPSLGGNGLSNQGETLSLRRDEIVLSEAPPEPKPKAGFALVRGEDPATGAAVWALGAPTPLADVD